MFSVNKGLLIKVVLFKIKLKIFWRKKKKESLYDKIMRIFSFYLSLFTSFFILNLSIWLYELDAKLYYRMLCHGPVSIAAIKTSIVLEYVIHICLP